MPNCNSCGTMNDDSAHFCKQCGASLSAQSYPPPPPPQRPSHPSPPPPPAYGAPSESGLQQNVAAMLCYMFGWLSGLIFLFIDKRPFVRFHAMQSLILFGGIHILHMVLAWVLMPVLPLLIVILGLLTLASPVLWILLMFKAYKFQWYRLPLIGDIALEKSQQ